MKKILLIALLVSTVSPLLAQDEEINVAGLVFLNYKNTLPDGILAGKSVVLVSSPNKPGESIAEDWHPMAEEAHPILTKAGLDFAKMELEFGMKIQTGKFGADMKVELVNDGPVTIIIDSKNKS